MTQTTATTSAPATEHPWRALFALCIGFFMLLVDMTIVTVATPDIMSELGASANAVLWVTSAYMLTYAIPVLIMGRLGDRIGPKWVYLAGLAVFTASSLWCGLAHNIESLVAARAVQGLGAAMMTPQTMATITRIFPADRRGSAMALWGATAGMATLVGPLAGGLLVAAGGWEWIFFVNVPIGIIAIVLNWWLVPVLETHQHTFDWLGVALSGLGMFCVVFGLQNGEKRGWDTLTWLLVAGGIAIMALFVWWQSRNRNEPLVPLQIFADRNFSVSSLAISCMGFAAVAMGFPLMLYAQLVRGYTALEASMLMVPMALVSFVAAPFVGRLTDRMHPRLLAGMGFFLCSVSLFWLTRPMTVDSAIWTLIAPVAVFGLGSAAVWSPLAATATRNLPMRQAGAGAGVYNATRLVGSVIGSAAVAVLIDLHLNAHGLGGALAGGHETAAGSAIPAAVASKFAGAMSDVMLLPAAALAVGFVAALFFTTPRHLAKRSDG
ncbi:EmrB/QacA subfamily drug resistance transporter [Nocardioides albertanoniae]|uniref:EmrB/QacA subfamily drug resistance transporter n=1 Tax=Nocardioides albertanoniae TaxID=1175486 RepID=A0A543A2M4_9ACTN|nr:DHA2 family efflux MFS transporter permease subunit [Nocardioides albertanoniae]TQL66837.1 EmrB/QacA subfamily drug resistance transporter [Nocardioides albertanoniae]